MLDCHCTLHCTVRHSTHKYTRRLAAIEHIVKWFIRYYLCFNLDLCVALETHSVFSI